MTFKSMFSIVLVAAVFTGCTSPQKITLKDNTEIQSKDEVKYNRKTGFYDYEDLSGNSNSVNSASVLKIEEL